ncbi:MAG: hypothetical protein PF495_17555, partial [Spirochaetales bacterium]|nr:hypothetical protein [Spirochaetales bacterium]
SFKYENYISFTAKNNQIKIGDQMFDFKEGSVFLVSFNDNLNVKYIDNIGKEKLKSLVESDQRVITFFKR